MIPRCGSCRRTATSWRPSSFLLASRVHNGGRGHHQAKKKILLFSSSSVQSPSSSSSSDQFSTTATAAAAKNNTSNNAAAAAADVVSLRQAWPLLQERFARIRNPATGALDLLSAQNQAALDRQFSLRQQPNNGRAAAAVLVLLIAVDGQPCVLFTRRAAHLAQHAAEISFPGGHHDAAADGDSLVDTAVREAVEELLFSDGEMGSDDGDDESDAAAATNDAREANFRRSLSVLGTTSPLPSVRGVPVTAAIAAQLDSDYNGAAAVAGTFPGDGGREVESVFAVPVRELLRVETTHGPPAARFNFQNDRAPCFPIFAPAQPPKGNGDNHHGTNDDNDSDKIWGLTAYILRPVLRKLLEPVFFPKR